MTQTTTATAPTTRPASFDAQILQYEGGLRRLAYKLSRTAEDAHNLYIDTVIKALTDWEKLRTDGGPWLWLQYMMRGLARDRRNKGRLRMVEAPLIDATTPPAQYHAARLSETLAALKPGRDTDVLLRHAAGDTLVEIGADLGVGRERARQLEARARGGLGCA